MSKLNISLDLINESSCNDLSIALYFDEYCFFNQCIDTGIKKIVESIENTSGEHTFKIVLNGKKVEHTQLDEHNNIVNDVLISISNVKFDDINIDTLLINEAVYKHNQNGHLDFNEYKFFGPMGCNGEVVLKFSTPIHLWLLEKL